MTINPVKKEFTFDDIDDPEDYYLGATPEIFKQRYVAWYGEQRNGQWHGIDPDQATMQRAEGAFRALLAGQEGFYPDSIINANRMKRVKPTCLDLSESSESLSSLATAREGLNQAEVKKVNKVWGKSPRSPFCCTM
jgi:hypothetical protein